MSNAFFLPAERSWMSLKWLSLGIKWKIMASRVCIFFINIFRCRIFNDDNNRPNDLRKCAPPVREREWEMRAFVINLNKNPIWMSIIHFNCILCDYKRGWEWGAVMCLHLQHLCARFVFLFPRFSCSTICMRSFVYFFLRWLLFRSRFFSGILFCVGC